MEALTAASVGLLTIYDMCKAVDRGMMIDDAPARKAGRQVRTLAGGIAAATADRRAGLPMRTLLVFR